MKKADEYFSNSRKIAVRTPELHGKMVRYQVFAREDGIVAGCNKSVAFLRDKIYGPLRIDGLQDGDKFENGRPVLTIEAPFDEIVNRETTCLGFLSYSGGAANMKKIVEIADGVPVIDMSARHYPEQLIEEISAAAYLSGASGTSTEEGCEYVQRWYNSGDDFKCYASLPHAMAAVAVVLAKKNNVYPSVMAAILFNKVFSDKPITVLVDYEGMELNVVKQAYEILGKKIFAVRLDTHGGRNMQGTYALNEKRRAAEYVNNISCGRFDTFSLKHLNYTDKYFYGNGVTIEATYRMREYLDSIGAKDVKIVVSSGFNEKKVKCFQALGAPMDFMAFTADISHVYENGEWKFRTKVGLVHEQPRDYKTLFVRE